jgi:hypothetical protein
MTTGSCSARTCHTIANNLHRMPPPPQLVTTPQVDIVAMFQQMQVQMQRQLLDAQCAQFEQMQRQLFDAQRAGTGIPAVPRGAPGGTTGGSAPAAAALIADTYTGYKPKWYEPPVLDVNAGPAAFLRWKKNWAKHIR